MSHIGLYQPVPTITYALISMSGVRTCCYKNKLVVSSLSLNPVHFLHPER